MNGDHIRPAAQLVQAHRLVSVLLYLILRGIGIVYKDISAEACHHPGNPCTNGPIAHQPYVPFSQGGGILGIIIPVLPYPFHHIGMGPGNILCLCTYHAHCKFRHYHCQPSRSIAYLHTLSGSCLKVYIFHPAAQDTDRFQILSLLNGHCTDRRKMADNNMRVTHFLHHLHVHRKSIRPLCLKGQETVHEFIF